MSNSFVTPWTVDRQAPLSMGFSRQEYWTGLPFLSSSPGDLSNPGIKFTSPALQADSLPLSPSESPPLFLYYVYRIFFFPPQHRTLKTGISQTYQSSFFFLLTASKIYLILRKLELEITQDHILRKLSALMHMQTSRHSARHRHPSQTAASLRQLLPHLYYPRHYFLGPCITSTGKCWTWRCLSTRYDPVRFAI